MPRTPITPLRLTERDLEDAALIARTCGDGKISGAVRMALGYLAERIRKYGPAALELTLTEERAITPASRRRSARRSKPRPEP